MYRVPLAGIMMVSPALDLCITGTVQLGESIYRSMGDPAPRHTRGGAALYPNWIYLSCNLFQESELVFKVSAPKLSLLGLRGTAAVRHDGQVYGMNRLRTVLHDLRVLRTDGEGSGWWRRAAAAAVESSR